MSNKGWDKQYCYPGSNVLRNKYGIKNSDELSEKERSVSIMKQCDILAGALPKKFDFSTLCKIHKQLFSEIYSWAGEARTVGIAKVNSFATPFAILGYSATIFENLKNENYLQGLPQEKFIERLSYFMGEVNALHPFREGNGRTQRIFFQQLSERAGYILDFSKANKEALLQADISAINLEYEPLQNVLKNMISPIQEIKMNKIEITFDYPPPINPSYNFYNSVIEDENYQKYEDLCRDNGIDTTEFTAVLNQLADLQKQLDKSQNQVIEMQKQLDDVHKNPVSKPLVQTIKAIGTVIFFPITAPIYLLKNAEKIITEGAKNAIDNFGKLGVKALNLTANLLKVKEIVKMIGTQAKKEIKASDEIVNRIGNFAKSYHTVGAGLKNLGNSLLVKPQIDPKEVGEIAQTLEAYFKKHSAINIKILNKARQIYKALDTLEKVVEKPKEPKTGIQFGKVGYVNPPSEPSKNKSKDLKKDTDERSERDDD